MATPTFENGRIVRSASLARQGTAHFFALALMLLICGFVAWQSWDYTQRMFDIGRTSDTAGISMWIPHGSVAAGFGLIVTVCLWQLIRELKIELVISALLHRGGPV